MTSLVEKMDRRWYPGVGKNWDDQLFRDKILTYVSAETDVLDLGAGAGIVPQMNFIEQARTVTGVDPDPRVSENPFLTHAVTGLADNLPLDDNSFDLVISDNVLEHLPEPEKAFAEVARVLRPGGHFLFKTPNLFHYMPTIARLTPHQFHQFINRLRGREEVDTFPTLYRANSRGRIRKLADSTGLEVTGIELIESRPEYMRLSAITYLLGAFYERVVNAAEFLALFRILMIGDLRLKV